MTKEPMKYYYFSYGENMLKENIEHKVGPVKDLGVATLPERWMLDFSMPCNQRNQTDSTGKIKNIGSVNITFPGDSVIYGVLYKLTPNQMKKLDTYAGIPTFYKRQTTDVFHKQKYKKAQLYTAVNPQPDLKPKKQYLEEMVRGALNHGLPTQYIEYITRLGFID